MTKKLTKAEGGVAFKKNLTGLITDSGVLLPQPGFFSSSS